MKTLATIGDNCVDIYPQLNKAFSGGNAVNVAVYCTRYGIQPGCITWVGDDDYGTKLKQDLARMGVDISHVHTKHGVTAQTQVELHDNDRVFGDYTEGVMADFALSEEDYAWLAQYDIVHAAIWGHAEDAFPQLHAAGKLTAFDFSDKWDSPLWQTLVPHLDFAFASAPQEDEALRLKMKAIVARGAGVVIVTLGENGNQICDFNSEKGLQAAEAIRAICNHPAYTSGDDTVLQGGMGDAICAGISGTWVAAAMKEKLGDNYAAAKLPTFTVDGEQVQMGSFLGCKILGVNTQTQHPVEAMELAEYLTSEDAQIRRYEVRGYGPSNLNAAASEEVSADVALSALAAQSEFGVSQHVLGTFWTPAEAFGAELEAHSEADLQTLLDQFVSQVTAQ